MKKIMDLSAEIDYYKRGPKFGSTDELVRLMSKEREEAMLQVENWAFRS